MPSEDQYPYPHEAPRAEKPVRTPRFPVVGLIGALLCVLAFWFHNRSHDSLLVGASRVRNADDIRIVGWTSESEVLAFSPRFPSREAIVLNLETGSRKRLDKLTAALFSHEDAAPLFRPRVALSPDRKWLLFAATGREAGAPDGPHIAAVRLDGSTRLTWKPAPRAGERGASMAWSADSSRWYRFRRIGGDPGSSWLQVFEYRLDNPKAVTVREIQAEDFRPRAYVHGKALSSDYFWGDAPPLDREPAFRTLDLNSPSAEPKRVSLKLPEGTDGYFLLPAANADFIVVDSWTSRPPERAWWQKWLGSGEGDRERIWHTVLAVDSNGKKLRDLGRIRTRFHERMGDTVRVMSCSPSGKRVLFRMHESLYFKELR